MRIVISVALVCSVLFAATALAQLPTGNNVKDAWYQGGFDGIRLLYGYSSDKTGDDGVADFHCRVDYYHDGRVRLLAIDSWIGIPDAPINKIVVFYELEETELRQHEGNKLVTTAYQYLSGPYIVVEPVISAEDLFTKRCVPLLDDLFEQIPEPEVTMFKDQYGGVFGLR